MSVAKERPHCAKPCMRRAKPGRKTCGDRSCAARAGNRARVDYREPRPHKCGFKGCTSWVERTAAHKCEADYRRRRFCDEHQHAGKGRAGRRKKAVRVSEVKRPCRRDGCQRKFASTDKRQVYCGHACAVAARLPGKRPSKVCQCGCGTRFERPNGLNTKRWERRRFVDAAHRSAAPKELRTVQRPKPAGPHPHALNLPGGAVPGAARAGNRKAPVIRGAKPAKVGGNAQRPERSVFGDVAPAAPVRFGQVPVVERVVRVAPRPSFGLSRRSADPPGGACRESATVGA